MKRITWLLSIMLLAIASACNVDNDIIPGNKPTIEFNAPDGVYTVKIGHDVYISPIVGNGDGAEFIWSSNGQTISKSRDLVMNCPRLGSFYVMLTVTTPAGATSAEARIDVLETTPPVIDVAIPEGGMYVLSGQDYTIAPRFQHSDVDGFEVNWSVDGQPAGQGETFTFRQSECGVYTVSVRAANEDGEDSVEFPIHVVNELPRAISFPPISALNPATTRYIFAGREVVLIPELYNISSSAEFTWSVNGVESEIHSPSFSFTPDTPGTYIVKVTADETSAEMTVVCVSATESSRRRVATGSSSPYINKVYEYVPAPGQFIGDTSAGSDMPAGLSSANDAADWAKNRLDDRKYVSLGACCGYIIAGFDHSVEANMAAAELAVWGNSFDKSNEPGTVWVMQDVNGNGLPDDEWYELRGSEYSNPATLHNYIITYYRPNGTGMDVQWTDNYGNSGVVNFLSSYHGQTSYYPSWIASPTLTLRGCCLPANGVYNATTGQWSTSPFSWGYADNFGSDVLSSGVTSDGGQGECNGLSIKNAVLANGKAVSLSYIDFVMIQTGVMQQLGRLGETSTEVYAIGDYNLLSK